MNFDHQKSDVVDVFPNAEGEFIQVWSSPRGTEGRRLMLTYLRTPTGPRNVSNHLYFDEGPVAQVEMQDLRRWYYYREGKESWTSPPTVGAAEELIQAGLERLGALVA